MRLVIEVNGLLLGDDLAWKWRAPVSTFRNGFDCRFLAIAEPDRGFDFVRI
jgi:hypothetical protein